MDRINSQNKAVDLWGAGKHGWRDGNIGVGVLPTAINAAFLNGIQEELASVIEAAGIVLDANSRTQLFQALFKLTPGRLVRTLVYYRVAGVQNVSINGAAGTTVGAGNYVPSALAASIRVKGQGAGGASAGATNPSAGNVSLGAPGKSGAYGESIFPISAIGAGVVVAVGLGGAPVNAAAGNTGGTTSFGALLTCPGGTGGGVLNNVTPPITNGNGGSVSASGTNVFHAPGIAGFSSTAISSSLGSMWGGSGGGTVFGPATPPNVGNSNGLSATTIGAGGSGVVLVNGGGSAIGGSGGDGILIVQEYT